MRAPLLAIALFATGVSFPLAAQDHLVARINDPLSHGQVGDNLLSLNEVILLNKRALLPSALSAAETTQILGTGGDVAWADIDFTTLARITLERDLDTIDDTPHGLIITGSQGRPVIDLAGTRGFIAIADFADFRNLVIENAAVAITLTQNHAIYGTVIDNVLFRNIGSCALRATTTSTTAMQETRIQIEKTTFQNVPTAVELFDTGIDRQGNLMLLDSTIQGGTQGLAVHLGPGGTINVLLERSSITGTTNGVVFDRPTAADTRRVNLSSLHLTVRGADTAFAFQGSPGVADTLALHMMDLAGSTHALRLWPLGTQLEATVEDGRLDGGVSLLTGTGKGILAANLRARNGVVEVGSQGAPVRVTDSILRQNTVQSQGSTAIGIDACRFEGGSVTGSAGAPISISGSYVGSTTVAGYATSSNPVAAPQLGSMDVTPLSIQIGTSGTLQADLPPNLVGQWFIGLAETLPYYGPRPLHLYFWLAYHVPLPGLASGQAQSRLLIPNDPSLIGWDWVVQLAVVANGHNQAPPLSLPPGRRLLVR